MQPLKFLSAGVVERLATGVQANQDRYTTTNFLDLAKESGWALETNKALVNEALFHDLRPDATPEAEEKNSLLVYRALVGLTPAMARDERIWARLCHVEGLEYARARWLRSGSVESRVQSHFFAPGFPGCRDDNAIGRLWWNAHIAKLGSPANLELGLKRLLSRANVRLQIVDRADTAFRQPLLAGLIRILESDWFHSYDAAVADFMYEVNKASGGIIFEALSEKQIDAHLAYCMDIAKRRKRT